ncbi:aryl-alcohol dehydrogenase [Nocardia farcinica]|uniref:Aryl-alcohol dehydrogenase n=1 Tax=Nocardia farcinica TaxID=37329 RepID=A0A0H5P020_NOCFR|nr:NAD(P)-dependent alcohol dehydrogenase [Nocardia farcinica]AXK84905.1 NAD(P)-dependent alcohol dehydrogenase [Nocardia farcinica]CRY75746.1 Aryl-alcohol dehydrogenase [Nocardia farcinica]SIS70596.1 aryl-alcohol dehydrogenase [Nocardia farcinica]
MRTTTAALSRDPRGPFQLEQVCLDAPRPDEILVRVLASGICHTDLVSRAAGAADRPVLLGHEGAGVVEEVGGAVTAVRPGDHVVLTFRHCGACRNCATGRPAYCRKATALNTFGRRADGTPRVTVDGAPVLDGFFGQSSLAGYALATADNTVVIDPSVDPVVAAPLGCGFQTGAGAVLNLLRPEADSWLVVYGAGAVGLAALLAARTLDGVRTVVVETSAQRRALALELGATAALDPADGDTTARVRELTGRGADHALEATGIPTVLADAVRALGVGGTVAAVGLGTGAPPLDMRDIVVHGKSIRGCLEGDSVPTEFVPRLLELYRSGRLPLDRLVSVYPSAEIETALADQRAGTIVKPVLRW